MDRDRKILAFAGFKKIKRGWKAPNGDAWINGEEPVIDPNFLAEYVFPKLWVCDIKLEEGIFWFVRVAHPNFGEGKGNSENLLEACLQAVEQIMGDR